MKIDYSVYLKNNLALPLIIVIVFIAFGVVNAVLLYKNMNTKSVPYYTFSIVVSIVILCYTSFSLSHGLNLLFEKEQDALVVSGEVTDITFVYSSPRYYINNRACRAVWIHIGNQKYYIVDTDEISIGDEITIHYLPRSLFIIEYNKGVSQ